MRLNNIILQTLPKSDKNRVVWLQYFTTLSACLVSFSAGNHLGWFGPTNRLILAGDSKITMTNAQGSWVASILEIGSIVGSILSSVSIDYFGRKGTILISTIPLIVAPVLYILAESVSVLYVGRFISGITVGASRFLIGVYIGEIASPNIRGVLCSLVFMSLSFGILCEFSIAPFVSIVENSYFLLSIPVICALLMTQMPESPYYLLMKGNFNAARSSLQRLRACDNVEDELASLHLSVVQEQKEKGNFSELVRIPSNRKALIVVIGIYSGLKFSGVNAITSYAQNIFDEIGSDTDPAINGILLGSAMFLSSCSCGFFIDSWGRRPLLITSCFTTVLPLAIVGTYFYCQYLEVEDITSYSLIPVISLLGFEVSTSIGIAPVAQVCVGELFPTNVKAMASFVTSIYQSCIGFITVKMFQIISDTAGRYVAFWILAGITTMSGCFMVYFVPETKKLSLMEVQKGLKENNK